MYIQVHVIRLTAYPHHLGGHTMVGQSWQVLLIHQMSGHQTTQNKQELCWSFEGVLYNLPKRLSFCQWNYFPSKSARVSHYSALPNQPYMWVTSLFTDVPLVCIVVLACHIDAHNSWYPNLQYKGRMDLPVTLRDKETVVIGWRSKSCLHHWHMKILIWMF